MAPRMQTNAAARRCGCGSRRTAAHPRARTRIVQPSKCGTLHGIGEPWRRQFHATDRLAPGHRCRSPDGIGLRAEAATITVTGAGNTVAADGICLTEAVQAATPIRSSTNARPVSPAPIAPSRSTLRRGAAYISGHVSRCQWRRTHDRGPSSPQRPLFRASELGRGGPRISRARKLPAFARYLGVEADVSVKNACFVPTWWRPRSRTRPRSSAGDELLGDGYGRESGIGGRPQPRPTRYYLSLDAVKVAGTRSLPAPGRLTPSPPEPAIPGRSPSRSPRPLRSARTFFSPAPMISTSRGRAMKATTASRRRGGSRSPSSPTWSWTRSRTPRPLWGWGTAPPSKTRSAIRER